VKLCRTQWPRGLRRRSAASWLLGSRLQIPLGAWMFVCCLYVVLSCVGRGLCDGLIIHPEESYCVSVCVWSKNPEKGGQRSILDYKRLWMWMNMKLCLVGEEKLPKMLTWFRSGGSSVSIVSDYGLDDRAIGVRSPAGAKDVSSNLCVQTGSGAHPASCTMGTGGPFSRGKVRQRRDADHSPHLVPRSRMSRSYTSSPPKCHHSV
jgi:hypothetical protein